MSKSELETKTRNLLSPKKRELHNPSYTNGIYDPQATPDRYKVLLEHASSVYGSERKIELMEDAGCD